MRFRACACVLAGAPAEEAPAYPGELRALAAELGPANGLEMPGFVLAEASSSGCSVFVTATYRDSEGFGSKA